MNLFDDLFNTLPKEEKKLSNAESYIQKRDAIQPPQDTEDPKSAIQPSKQFDEPVEPENESPDMVVNKIFDGMLWDVERTEEDDQDKETYSTLDSLFVSQVKEGEINPKDKIPNYAERNEAYYQFRRSKPDEYISFRDWMEMQTDPLAEAFIGVVKPNVGNPDISPKKDYRDSMPPGLKELQDRNGINQPNQDTGQPDLFEDAIYKVISDNAFGDVKGKVAEDMITVGQAMFKSYLDEDKPKIEYIDPIAPIKPEPIQLVIKGDPTAQKRHRSVNMGKFTRQYDPSAADKADFLSIVQANAPEIPISSPIRLELKFYFARPKAHFGTGKKEGELKDTAPKYHTSRPDIDNCSKFCMDALNGIYWKDDSYIVESVGHKLYDINPRTEITIIKL